MSIKIEKNIPIPTKMSASLTEEEKNTIKEMQIGDSFIIKKYALMQRYRHYARAIGKELIARKNYTGTTKDSFNYRVWFFNTCKPHTHISNKHEKIPKGSLPKNKVLSNAMFDGGIEDGYAISQEVVALAEMREENKKICEDMEKIKKILQEELGHSMDTFHIYGRTHDV